MLLACCTRLLLSPLQLLGQLLSLTHQRFVRRAQDLQTLRVLTPLPAHHAAVGNAGHNPTTGSAAADLQTAAVTKDSQRPTRSSRMHRMHLKDACGSGPVQSSACATHA